MAITVKKLPKKENVYDIEVKDNHNFYANGAVVHNCEINFPTVPLQHIDDPNAEIGMCVLAAANMLTIKDNELEDVCDITVRMLDALISLQDYPVMAAERFCTKRRALGIGVSNLAGYLAKHKAFYGDPNSLDVVNTWFEQFQYYLLKASNNLAKELGACELFSETTYADGKLPIDHYCKAVDTLVSPELKMDWEELRESIAQHGLRNSTLSAQMPCESSSLIQNSTNGIEPVRSLLSYKKSKKGALPQIVPNFAKYKNYYTLAWDMKENKGLIDVCAVIQKYMDMAISANVYYNYVNYPKNELPISVAIHDMLYAYKMGQKTRYYINTDDGDKSVDIGHSTNTSDCESGACAI